MRKALILFDVDGTLLVTGGATTRCIHRAARQVLGDRFRPGPIAAGMLDPQIYLGLAEACGIADAAGHLDAYKAAYFRELEDELRRTRANVVVLPGVRDRLADLHARPDVVLGLLTGNFRRGVELKLAAADLDPGLFPVGAFAEDGQKRSDLVRAALRQFERITGAPGDARQVILVGDTPRDIACAREAGCRVLAVASGVYSVDQLRADSPDCVVSSLVDGRPLDDLIRHVVGFRQ